MPLVQDSKPISDSILQFTQELVRIPAQGGIDSPKGMLDAVTGWFQREYVPFRILFGADKQAKAIVSEVTGSHPGPTICFNACLDTAPVGDPSAWKFAPLEATIADGWLYGRGCADSKAAVAIFCHLVRAFHVKHNDLCGRLVFLFDADEHTGGFGGCKEFMAQCEKPDALGIGYPGSEVICTGARGFYRVEINVFGLSAHSGSSTQASQNAAVKAADLVTALSTAMLPAETDSDFAFGPKLTICGIEGGNGFSMVPDKCVVRVDLRLTPSFTQAHAAELIENIVRQVDAAKPTSKPTAIEAKESCPPYKLSPDLPLLLALKQAASEQFGRAVPTKVVGPSNIGNYLAGLGVPTICGFGVTCKNIHAADECIEIASIERVYEAYFRAIERALMPSCA